MVTIYCIVTTCTVYCILYSWSADLQPCRSATQTSKSEFLGLIFFCKFYFYSHTCPDLLPIENLQTLHLLTAPPPAPPSLPTASSAPPKWRRSFPHTLPPDKGLCVYMRPECVQYVRVAVHLAACCATPEMRVCESGSRRRRSGDLWRCVYLGWQLSVSLFICSCLQGNRFRLEYWVAKFFALFFFKWTQPRDLTWNLWLVTWFHPSG